MINTILVEDDLYIQKHFVDRLAADGEFHLVGVFRDAFEAEKHCDATVKLVLMDVQTQHKHSGLAAAKRIILDIQSDIHAHTMERMLMQKLDDCQVVISESPDATAEWCKTHRPDVLLMEVKAYSPWMFKERMAIRDKVKRNTESCRVILFVDDDTDEELTEKVRQAKREGLIDAFLFGSVSENYFASVIDSV
ncbi:hypothetical protein [Ruminococcus bicirculans (ex Wegman et al. 2014)]